MLLTMWGFSSTPSLAMADMAVTSCSGVTAMLWPMAIVATSESRMSSGLKSRPPSSPGSSMPVGVPKPKSFA